MSPATPTATTIGGPDPAAGNDRRAVVVGGGIAGLSAAFYLVRDGWTVDVYEAADRWGGKILTTPVGDRPVDAGPDTFLARVEPGRRLCSELGLADELTSPVAPVPAYLVRDGALHPLPAGSMLGVPTDLDALATSALVSPEGIDRARYDLTSRHDPPTGDISVGALCRARLGDEVTERLIDPLLGGINASDIDRLSLETGAPMLAAAIERGPSLIEGLQALRPSTGPTLGTAGAQPVFYGLPGGIARIVDALVDALEDEPNGADGTDAPVRGHGQATLHLGEAVESLDAFDAAVTVLATPADVAATLVGPRSGRAAAELATIDYASVAQVTVELPIDGVARVLDASGILFPRVDGTMLTASTWFSTKWAHYQRDDTVLIRLTCGRYGDDRHADLSDDELTDRLLAELGHVVPITAEPLARRVQRWPRAFPQYVPGHGRLLERIDEALRTDAPGVFLVGASYRGIGIPACILSGRSVADALAGR